MWPCFLPLCTSASPSTASPTPTTTLAAWRWRRSSMAELPSFSRRPKPKARTRRYGFRQDNNFFYLSGSTEPGAALVVAPAVRAKNSAQPYTEILFLPVAQPDAGEVDRARSLGPDDPQAPAITGFDRVANLDTAVGGTRQSAGCRPPGALPRPCRRAVSRTRRPTSSTGCAAPTRCPCGLRVNDVKPALAQLRVIKDAGRDRAHTSRHRRLDRGASCGPANDQAGAERARR